MLKALCTAGSEWIYTSTSIYKAGQQTHRLVKPDTCLLWNIKLVKHALYIVNGYSITAEYNGMYIN